MKIQVLACDFCEKTQHQVEQLIAAPKVMICNECIDICNKMIVEARAEKASANAKTKEGACGP